MTTNILVSPHGDDELFSTYHILTTIPELTLINCSSPRGSRRLANDLDIKYLEVDSEDLGIEFNLRNTITRSSYVEYLLDIKNNMRRSDSFHLKVERKKKYIKEVFDYCNYRPDETIIYCPLGIKHIDHVITREVIESYFNLKDIIYYAEYPYYNRNYGRKQINIAIDMYILDKILIDIDRKMYLLRKYYGSQLFYILDNNNLPKIEYYFKRNNEYISSY